jgi:DNA-binding NtrC family response regulator
MPLLIIEDEYALAAALSTVARRLGAEPTVAASGQAGLGKLSKRPFDLVVLDIGLPDMSGLDVLRKIRATHSDLPVLIITAHGTLENALEAKKLGAADYFLKPLDLPEFQQALRAYLAKTPAPPTPQPPEASSDTSLMIGAAPAMQRAYATIAQACGTTAPILISGPAGSGKSLAAHVIHRNAMSQSGPLIHFRADEWPSDQLPSALLGSETSAYTKAQHGVLYIEEIAHLPLHAQASLERTLKEADPASSARILAGTTRDLLTEVREGRFREDLYYRLKIIEVSIPALTERTEDIPALASYFLSRATQGTRELSLSPETLACLKAHLWPGQVRELQNAMQHAATVCTAPLILPRHLPESIARSDTPATGPSRLESELDTALARWVDHQLTAAPDHLPTYDHLSGTLESHLLRHLLSHFDHKPTHLATALQMNRATLRRKCKDLE